MLSARSGYGLCISLHGDSSAWTIFAGGESGGRVSAKNRTRNVGHYHWSNRDGHRPKTKVFAAENQRERRPVNVLLKASHEVYVFQGCLAKSRLSSAGHLRPRSSVDRSAACERFYGASVFAFGGSAGYF